MGKPKKKSCKIKSVAKKEAQTIRNEAKAKNLEFLLIPQQQPIRVKTKAQQKMGAENDKNVSSATALPQIRGPVGKQSRSKIEKGSPAVVSVSPQGKRSAVRVPLIDMDASDNQQQVRMRRMSLLGDWLSDDESDEADSNKQPLTKGDADPDSCGMSSDSSIATCPVREVAARNTAEKKTYSRPITLSTGHQQDVGSLEAVQNETHSQPTTTGNALNLEVCVCGLQPKIEQLIKQNSALLAQNQKLKRLIDESNTRCRNLTDSLNAKVLGIAQETIFTEIHGYPDRGKLKTFSETAGSRDYIFVKLLMLEICTEGLQNITISGRASNNPHGRKGGERSLAEEIPSNKIRLDPDKKKYIQERFVEHRRYQGDSISVAGLMSKDCRALMTRVISYYGNK